VKLIKRIAYFLVFLYLLGCCILYIGQDNLLFNPDHLAAHHIYRKGEEVRIEVEEDIEISCYYNTLANPKGVILYLHGNKGSIRRCIRQSEMMEGFGYDIFMPDYRGYGKSDGSPVNDHQMYADIQKAYEFLKQKYNESQIVVIGYSLGTGMASYIAANNKPQQLLMVAPFESIINMKNRIFPFIPSFLIKYAFRNDKHLEDITCPVTILHALNDEVIPYNSSENLKARFPDKIEFVTLNDRGHRGSIFHNRLRQVLKEKL